MPSTRTFWPRFASMRASLVSSDASTRLCAETLAGIADPLFPALASARVRSPGAAARAMLAGLLEPLESHLEPEPMPDWLLPHQTDAVQRARAILRRFGGVLIADGVGLGKTFIGLALAHLERAAGGSAVALVPASLVGDWREAAGRVGVSLAVHSHTVLAHGAPSLADRCTLVLVDESHAFRNPRTRRYDVLARLVTGRRVAMLSATPLNNTPMDVGALVHLFAPRDRFREFGVADLSRALRDGDAAATLALGAISVCRTRRLIEERFPDLRGAFPKRILSPGVGYDISACYGDMPALLDAIGAFAAARDDGPGAALLHLSLLRRMESSRCALRRSLARHRDVLDEIARAAESGLAITRGDVRESWNGEGAESQLALWPLLATTGGEVAIGRLDECRAAVARALDVVDASSSLADQKACALDALLSGELRGTKTIVFTEYRDTALYLLRRLRRSHRVLCVVGDTAWAGAMQLARRDALDAFAPRGRCRARNPLLDADVLVATDVLSEGLNLQDAGAVVSYDLPWNPVRVMQRAGRIDRLGSPHQAIRIAHLLPANGAHVLTSVLRVLREKLAAASRTLGVEPDPLASLWWVDRGAVPSQQALEQESWRRVAPFEARERWRAAAGPVTSTRGAPLVAAAVVDDDQPAAVGVLLALEWRGGIRIPLPYVLEAGQPPTRDAELLGGIATRALHAQEIPCEASLFTSALAAALPLARDSVLTLSAGRRGAVERGPGRAAAAELLERAAADAHRARIDDAALTASIDMLARDLPAGLDRIVGRLVRECGSPTELAQRIREILRTCPHRAPDLAGTPRLVLVAAIALATKCPSE